MYLFGVATDSGTGIDSGIDASSFSFLSSSVSSTGTGTDTDTDAGTDTDTDSGTVASVSTVLVLVLVLSRGSVFVVLPPPYGFGKESPASVGQTNNAEQDDKSLA